MLAIGFINAVSWHTLSFALIGCLLGTVIGVLPGIGPTAGIAMLLPVTSFLPPIPAIVMLAAIYYGAMYGGSTTSILLNVPGEAASVVTAIDGYQMTLQGRAGSALAAAAISSFVAGTIGLIGLSFLAPILAEAALKFGPPEYLGLCVLSFCIMISTTGGGLAKGMISAAAGMLIALIGVDPLIGQSRFAFGQLQLMRGLNIIAVIMGLFALSEVYKRAAIGIASSGWQPIRSAAVKWREVKNCVGATIRAAVVGFLLGVLPGCNPAVVSYLSYDLEKRVSRKREAFGKGAIRGVAAPEGANNSCVAGGFVPMLTLGIPTSASLAVLLSGLQIYGLQPGPLLFETQPEFVWTVIASMYVGNVILLVLNLPLVGLWARLVRIPSHVVNPLILLFCFLGTYSVRNTFFDVLTCLVFGIVGLVMDRLRVSPIPLVLGIILTPLLEISLRQTVSMGSGSLAILWNRPLTLVMLGAGGAIVGHGLVIRMAQYFRPGGRAQGGPETESPESVRDKAEIVDGPVSEGGRSRGTKPRRENS